MVKLSVFIRFVPVHILYLVNVQVISPGYVMGTKTERVLSVVNETFLLAVQEKMK